MDNSALPRAMFERIRLFKADPQIWKIHKCEYRVPTYERQRYPSTCPWLVKNRDSTCAVKRRWSTAGESPARELGSLHPEAIGAAVEETKPSELPV